MQAFFEKISASGQSFVVRERVDPVFDFRWHFHPEFELTYIVRSGGQRFVGDSIERYRDGDFVLLGPNLPHTWMSEQQHPPLPPLIKGGRTAAKSRVLKEGKNAARKTRVEHRAIYAQFLSDFAGEEFFRRPELAAVARLLERAAQGLRFTGKTQQAAARLMPELLATSGMTRLLKLLEILDLLAHSKHAVPLSSKTFAPSLKRRDERRIDDVCRFIHDNIAQPIEQPEAARRAHLSVSAFSRFFKKSLGRTFSEYVNELRVGQACRLLIESDKSVAEIAFGSGFENLSNFNRRFRALKGISPRVYRRKFG